MRKRGLKDPFHLCFWLRKTKFKYLLAFIFTPTRLKLGETKMHKKIKAKEKTMLKETCG